MDKSRRPIDWKLPIGLTASEHALFELGASAIIPYIEAEARREVGESLQSWVAAEKVGMEARMSLLCQMESRIESLLQGEMPQESEP